MVYKAVLTSLDPKTYQEIKERNLRFSNLIRIGFQLVKSRETLTDMMKLEVREIIDKILDNRLDKKLEEIGLKKQMEDLRPIGNFQVEMMKLDNRMIDLEHSLEVIQRYLNNR